MSGEKEQLFRHRRYEWDVNYRLKKMINELTKGSVIIHTTASAIWLVPKAPESYLFSEPLMKWEMSMEQRTEVTASMGQEVV